MHFASYVIKFLVTFKILQGLNLIDEALNTSYQEAQTYRFKLEEAEREIAHLRGKAKVCNSSDQELALEHARALCRKERKVKREVAAVIGNHSAQFTAEFGDFKKSEQTFADFRECRGAIGALWRTWAADYAYETEMEMITGYMDGYPGADLAIPSIEERIWGVWAPIPVSPNTEEVVVDVAGEDGEVNQPASAFGASIS